MKTRLAKGGDKSLIGNKGYRKYIKAVGHKAFAVDEDKIEAEPIYDGQWVLRTNMDLETELVAQSYKHL